LLDEGCFLLFGAGGGALFLDLGHAAVEVVALLGVFGLLAADCGHVAVKLGLGVLAVLGVEKLELDGVGAFLFAGFLLEVELGLDVLLMCHDN
jgi:uncharacterized membrane protein